MVALFPAVVVRQWFRYVTGILELTGAVLIMVPKTRRTGAALLATVLVLLSGIVGWERQEA